MTDLTDWLAEVHAADERVAREATEDSGAEEWRTLPETDDVVIRIGRGVVAERVFDPGTAAHIARHDPQSTLARIEAERMLAAMHRSDPEMNHYFCLTCAQENNPGADERLCSVDWPCPTLRALAWGYRGRDGYRADLWAPEGVSADA